MKLPKTTKGMHSSIRKYKDFLKYEKRTFGAEIKSSLIAVFVITILSNYIILADENYKPKGCSASTGPNVSKVVLEHPELQYQLISIKWSDIEPNIDDFNFEQLFEKIALVKSYNKKYALAVSMGGPGTPEWLFDSLKVPFIDYLFRGTTHYKLPLWWNDVVLERIGKAVNEIGNKLSSDSSLALVYVSQMTSNGNEGHLQYVSLDSLKLNGFTNEKWIDAAKKTAYFYSNAFPNKSIAFEIHDIDFSSEIPIKIINDLYEDPSLNHRIGAAIWWLSGKTTYQPSLINFLKEFKGEKYAQMIANSTQKERFQDSTIASAFEQAKELNIKYIELWYEEYKNNTIDSLMNNFNRWVDSNSVTGIYELNQLFECDMSISPNPASEYIEINLDRWTPSEEDIIRIYNSFGECVINYEFQITNYDNKLRIDISHLSIGVYYLKVGNTLKKIVILK